MICMIERKLSPKLSRKFGSITARPEFPQNLPDNGSHSQTLSTIIHSAHTRI